MSMRIGIIMEILDRIKSLIISMNLRGSENLKEKQILNFFIVESSPMRFF